MIRQGWRNELQALRWRYVVIANSRGSPHLQAVECSLAGSSQFIRLPNCKLRAMRCARSLGFSGSAAGAPLARHSPGQG